METSANALLYQDINNIKWAVGVYARVSTEHEEQKMSTEHQQQYFTEWCKNNNMEIYDYYVDDGKSGTTTKKRYDFQRMIDDARQGRINCIVARSITRFARNQVDALRTIRELQVKGVRFIFIEQALDTYKNDGLLGLFAWLAEEESRTISVRRKLGGRQAQKNGRFITSRTPLGYKSVDKKLVIDEEEAQIVREIFDLYLSGNGCQKIATILNEKGYKTRKGEAFAKTKVQYILENEAYKGWIVGNKHTSIDPITKKRIKTPPEQWIIKKNAHPAIISEEDFDKVQELMSDKKFSITKRTTHLLSGVVKCKECGSNMLYKRSVKKSGKVYEYYICNNRSNKGVSVCNNDTVKVTELKEIIQQEIMHLKNEPQLLEDLKSKAMEKIQKSTNTFEQDIKNSKLMIEKLQSQREKLVEKYIEGIIPEDIYKKKEAELSERIKEFSNKKTIAFKNIKDNNRFDNTIKRFQKELNNYIDIDDTTNSELKDIIKEIWIDKNRNVEIVMSFMSDGMSCHNAQTVTTVMPYCKPTQVIEILRKNKMITTYDKDNDIIYLTINHNLAEVI